MIVATLPEPTVRPPSRVYVLYIGVYSTDSGSYISHISPVYHNKITTFRFFRAILEPTAIFVLFLHRNPQFTEKSLSSFFNINFIIWGLWSFISALWQENAILHTPFWAGHSRKIRFTSSSVGGFSGSGYLDIATADVAEANLTSSSSLNPFMRP